MVLPDGAISIRSLGEMLYFFAMKYVWPLLFCFFLVACADKPTPVQSSRPTLVPKDSVLQADSLNPFAPIDRSPMDISYFPEDYTVQNMAGSAAALPVARVIYSRPHRQGRTIFGSLIKYREPWRLGANEATELELFQPLRIQGKAVGPGRYTLYAIPQEKTWTIIFNAQLFAWGLKPNAEKDIHHFDVPVQATPAPVEYFSMVFKKSPSGADLIIAWDTVVARLPLQF